MNTITDFRQLKSQTVMSGGINRDIFTEAESSDYDRIELEVLLIQQFTKKEYKEFTQFQRVQTVDYGYCGCEHDCCGCTIGKSLRAKYLGNSTFHVNFTVTRNY